ncbi:E1-like protein-activating enzyme Gsa7p/Apg7p [Kwoniella sp. CBS 9459]
MPVVQFQPLSSQPTPSFWSALTSHKLDEAKLDDSFKLIRGWMDEGRSFAVSSNSNSTDGHQQQAGIDGSVSVGGNAFGDDIEKPPPNSVPIEGILKNFNTLEQFRQVESKKLMFDQVVDMILESWDTDRPLINLFLLVTFADLKRYLYQYWFAFPAILTKPAWETDEVGFCPADPSEVESIRHQMTRLHGRNDVPQAILVKKTQNEVSIGSIASYQDFFGGVPLNQRCVAFRDPSSAAKHPGWPLRNLLSYLARKHDVRTIRVLCMREGSASQHGIVHTSGIEAVDTVSRPSAVGWERNPAGKLASRSADLGPTMDPARLAEQAVDLNLKLMKWRVMPTLDLEQIAQTRCLLLGAGTLGCYVARNLMPLFRFQDCLNGGSDKAGCAAERLREIFPGVNAIGHTLAVPMPGHACPQLASDLTRLETLIQSHDAIFLLMDSRESRWLPTMLGATYGKIVINAALGFDSYLVMRHGASSSGPSSLRLGCYFCNDVVAPADSMTDRTLDQMCTVTRPGVAPIAAATAVELLVSILQHPLGITAPACPTERPGGMASTDATASDLPPHQVRGSMANWRTLLISGPAFEQCTGCSCTVLRKYQEEGSDFVRRVIERPSTLEQVTGLDRLHEESEAALDNMSWSDSDESTFE